MRLYKLQSAIDRLDKSAQTIERLGKTMDIRVSREYREIRIKELRLTADHLARVEEEFADRRVNRVNLRREFFYATPAEVREVLERIAGNHLLEYNETPEALGYRAGSTDR